MFMDRLRKVIQKVKTAWGERVSSHPKLGPNRWRYYNYLK